MTIDSNFTIYAPLSYNIYCQNNKEIITDPSTEFIGCIFCRKQYNSCDVVIFYLEMDAACPCCQIDSVVAWHEIPCDTEEDKFKQLNDWYIEGFTTTQ